MQKFKTITMKEKGLLQSKTRDGKEVYIVELKEKAVAETNQFIKDYLYDKKFDLNKIKLLRAFCGYQMFLEGREDFLIKFVFELIKNEENANALIVSEIEKIKQNSIKNFHKSRNIINFLNSFCLNSELRKAYKVTRLTEHEVKLLFNTSKVLK